MKSRGFTIVELLIVIVVIAILAAISVAAYNGIQNRANDTAIQNDLSSLAKFIQLKAADTGIFPAGGATMVSGTSTGNSTLFPNVMFKPTKSAYATNTLNFFYCTGTIGGSAVFHIAARSKSNNTFRYKSTNGIENLGNIGGVNETITCQDITDPRTWAYGYNRSADVWNGWTNG